MRLVMIGSGSIGMLVTFYLTKQGHCITLLTNRKEQAQLINDMGINLMVQDKERDSVRISTCTFSDIQHSDSIDLLILAVKSYQVKDVLAKLNDLNINIRAILFLQNGMAHTELIPSLNVQEIAVGVVEHGAIRVNDFTVHHTGVGQLKWSYVRKGLGIVQSLLSEQTHFNFPISYHEHWNRVLEQKLIVNACVNPLTALFEVKNGELLHNNYCYALLNMVFEEVREILNLDSSNESWKNVLDVCEKTSENYSSMLLDIRYNRQTEVDSIIGYLIRRALEQNQDVTLLPFLLNGIRVKEMKVEGNNIE